MSTEKGKRLFLLDAFALIYRGYFAFAKNPRINSKGEETSAILGFTNTLLDVLLREKPSHIAVVFDTPKPTVRHEEYKEYKAHREAMPEAIQFALPHIHKILEGFNIPQISFDGYEADDVIGTLAKKAEKEGYTTYMMTPDKDYAQLVSENIFMYKPARMGNGIEIWGVDKVLEKFEIQNVEQVIDYLGMMGDASDNIPGLPGVGDKTAKKFIAQYGSMEGLLEHTDELKGKMKEKVEANKELGLLSKKLATIITDVPVEFNWESFEHDPPNIPVLKDIFNELEFRRLTDRLVKEFASPASAEAPAAGTAPATAGEAGQLDLFAMAPTGDFEESETGIKTLASTDHFYQTVDTPTARKLLVNNLLQQKEFCFDTETTSTKAVQTELVGFSFSYEAGKGYWILLPEEREEALKILEEFRPVFENEDILKIGQNLKFDLEVLRSYGIDVKGPFFDTMIAHYLISPDMRHGMDQLAASYLNYHPLKYDELTEKKGRKQKTLREVDPEKLKEYAVEDTDITLQLKYKFKPLLEEAGTLELFEKVELPLMSVLADMEIEGIRLDSDALKQMSVVLAEDVARLEKEILEEAGEDFKISSPKQLGVILFEKMQLVDKPKKTKTGQYSTSEDILSALAPKHKIVANILEYRSLQKLKSTYVDALPEEVNPNTGHIHTSYNQTVAATGRLSSNDPNLQNIPIRTVRGREVRKAFIPRDEEHILLAADYSQIELRLIAEISKDPVMMESFRKGEDIHAATAAKVFGIPLEEVSREQRSYAKTVNFGIIYGVSAFGLSQQTDLSRKEASELIKQYYVTYPTLKEYMAKQVDFARDHGYVETVMGRRRYLKDINSRNAIVRGAAERNAVNAPIQGSAADIIKKAMIAIQARMKAEGLKSKMLLQVHDELVFDVHKSELDTITDLVKHEMENAWPTEVPMKVDVGTGQNWLEAH